jgi:signal transduction histidine kinase
VSYWLVNVALVYLLLSYPFGRLTESLDRALCAAILVVVTLYLPTALLAKHFPSPSVWSLCASNCPSNAFALGHSNPGLITDLVVPLREVLTVAVFLAVPVAVWRHQQRAGSLLRGMYMAIVVIAGLQAVTFGVFFAVRHAAPTSAALHVVMWLNVVALPAVGVACVAGRVYRRLLTANALERLARELTGSATAVEVSRAVAGALMDPSLKILHSFPDEQEGWVDESGEPVALDGGRAAQEVTEVATGRWRIAILHDPVLAEHRALVESAGSYALAALKNDHLSGELRASLEALAESRARAGAVEHRERLTLERDLHDGAEQRLVALRIKLAVAAERLANDDDATIDEVRSFARGVYPTVLTQTGLGEAL